MAQDTLLKESGVYPRSTTKQLILNSEVKAVPRHYRRGKTKSEYLKRLIVGKRWVDLLLALAGIVVTLPFLPVAALVIKLSSSGPVFFKQERKGKGGRPFTCYKLRTMHTYSRQTKKNSDPNITQKGDDRIFKFGQFLRDHNLDELPQLYNVLRGDMSLVGPRPYMVVECEYWKDIFDDFKKREQVKPGLSGLAQVNGYRGGILDEEHMRTRLDYDLIYIKSYGIRIDLMIIAKTVLQMLSLNTNAH